MRPSQIKIATVAAAALAVAGTVGASYGAAQTPVATPAPALVGTYPADATDPLPPRYAVLAASLAVHVPTVVRHAAQPRPVTHHVKKKVKTKTVVHHKTTVYVADKATKGIIQSKWGPVHANTYFGPGYDSRYELTRQCIVVRESNNHRTSINSQGYSGYYQFGLSWTQTIQHWTYEYVPINQMSTYAQDMAFWKAFNHGAGANHWSGGRWSCPNV